MTSHDKFAAQAVRGLRDNPDLSDLSDAEFAICLRDALAPYLENILTLVDVIEASVEVVEPEEAEQPLRSVLDYEAEYEQRVLTPEQRDHQTFVDQRVVRKNWGEFLKSTVEISFLLTWTTLITMLARDIWLTSRDPSGYDPLLSGTVLVAMISATVVQTAGMAALVVGFGFNKNETKT